jgi:hypothetical protein
MTVVQRDLLGGVHTLTPTGRPLRPRQQAVVDLVAGTPGGVTADEAGAMLHSLKAGRWAHGADERCVFCGRDGTAVLRSKAVAPLVVRRRVSGRYELRAGGAVDRGSQLDGLPGWLQ